MTESFDADSMSSCKAAEDVELDSNSATVFTHDTGTVPTPITDLYSPSTATFGFNSTVSTHLWGRQAHLKPDLNSDESQSEPSHSDLSGDALTHQSMSIDDEDAEFVEELESVYSAYADVSTSPSGVAMRLSTVLGMEDIMSDTESVTDPHLYSLSMRIPRPRAWTGSP
jgi:hypothetical protein